MGTPTPPTKQKQKKRDRETAAKKTLSKFGAIDNDTSG